MSVVRGWVRFEGMQQVAEGKQAEGPPAPGRDRIMQSAIAVFAERGFSRTSTREIAERAGVPRSLIFHHFGTKLALYLAIIRDHTDHIMARLDASGGPDDSAVSQLARFIEVYTTCLAFETPCIPRVRVDDSAVPREAVEPIREQYMRVITRIERIFTAGVKSGAFRPMDTSMCARTLELLIRSLIAASCDIESIRDQAINYYGRSLLR